MRIKEIITKRTMYEAEDGKLFNTEYECQLHEWRLLASTVYAIVPHKNIVDATTDICSTLSKAEKTLKTYVKPQNYKIIKVFIDQRLTIKDIEVKKNEKNSDNNKV
jgi:hypothetical protein